MIKGDYILFLRGVRQHEDNRYDLLNVYDTLLVPSFPRLVQGLRLALQFYSDVTLQPDTNMQVDFRYDDGKELGSLGAPIDTLLSPHEKLHTILDVPDFEFTQDGYLIASLSVNNEKVAETELEIRLPRE